MSNDRRHEIPDLLQQAGGLTEGTARRIAEETGIPEADIYGVGSFYHMLARPDAKVRVCTGLSCQMAGADKVLRAAELAGLPVEGCSCLAGCDVPPAVLRDRRVLPSVSIEDIHAADGDWEQLRAAANVPDENWLGYVGPEIDDPDTLACNLLGAPDYSGSAFALAAEMGAEAVVTAIEESGLQGRGGAGFPAHIKWKGTRSQAETTRYVVLNADEGEPGTFKDREVMQRRPDKVLEGLAIAAKAIESTEVYLYLRGEFEIPWKVIEEAIQRYKDSGVLGDVNFHMHAGNGAYICGEETALLEALEGKRGMPRLKPPFPVEFGLWASRR